MSAGAKKKKVFLGKDRRVWRNISSYCARQKYNQLINNSIKFYHRDWLCKRNSAFKIPIIGSENSSPVVQTQAAVTQEKKKKKDKPYLKPKVVVASLPLQYKSLDYVSNNCHLKNVRIESIFLGFDKIWKEQRPFMRVGRHNLDRVRFWKVLGLKKLGAFLLNVGKSSLPLSLASQEYWSGLLVPKAKQSGFGLFFLQVVTGNQNEAIAKKEQRRVLCIYLHRILSLDPQFFFPIIPPQIKPAGKDLVKKPEAWESLAIFCAKELHG